MTSTSAPLEERLDFGGLSITFDQRVLRPRPWTAGQSRWAAELLRTAPPGDVLELCAGVGHIGLLAVRSTERRLVMVDLNEVACSFARVNAAAAAPAGGFEVRQGRLETAVPATERYAGILADPPYVPSHGTHRYPEDPLLAIDGGADGLDVAQQCLQVVDAHLAPGGWCLLQLATPEQASLLTAQLPGSGLGLVARETREYDGHGVVVHLARS